MKTCEITVRVTAKSDDMGMLDFAKAVNVVIENIQPPSVPEGIVVLILPGEPKNTRTPKPSPAQPSSEGAGEIPGHMKRGRA